MILFQHQAQGQTSKFQHVSTYCNMFPFHCMKWGQALSALRNSLRQKRFLDLLALIIGQLRAVPFVEQDASTARNQLSNWFCASVLSRPEIRAVTLRWRCFILHATVPINPIKSLIYSQWIDAQLRWTAQQASVFQEFQPGLGLGIVLNYHLLSTQGETPRCRQDLLQFLSISTSFCWEGNKVQPTNPNPVT